MNSENHPPHDEHHDPLAPGAPDFVETPDLAHVPPEREHLPAWLYIICGFALFLTGSSFGGLGVFGRGLYDQGPGAGAVVSSAGPGGAAAAEDPVELGKKLYNVNCASCHHADGQGQPGVFPPMCGSEWVVGSKERLAAILLHGVAGPLTVKGGTYGAAQMPAWSAALTPDKIANIMTYLRKSWGNTAGEVTEAEVTGAQTKFTSQAGPYGEAALLQIAPHGPDPTDKK